MVKEDWKVIEEIEFQRLSKLSLPMSQEPDELWEIWRSGSFQNAVDMFWIEFRLICGSLEYYDKTYDRISTKINTSVNKFKKINRVYHNVTTSDDPVIRMVRLAPNMSSALSRAWKVVLFLQLACQEWWECVRHRLHHSYVDVLQSICLSVGYPRYCNSIIE